MIVNATSRVSRLGSGTGFGRRERVAQGAHAVGHGLADGIDLFGVEDFAGLDCDQRLQLLVEPEKFASELARSETV